MEKCLIREGRSDGAQGVSNDLRREKERKERGLLGMTPRFLVRA